jgi:two-component system, OmpR family, sensor histidine kinase ArlS
MSLKQQFAIYSSIIFSAILGIVLLSVWWLFNDFRKEEFKLRLEEKAFSTIELLVDVNVSERHVLDIIDKNTVDKLFNDKILVFNSDMRLIYSNIGGTTINYSISDLQMIKSKGSYYVSKNDNDKYGLYYKSNDKSYFIIVTAEDKYGNKQLVYLRYLLFIAFFIGMFSIIILSYTLSARILLILENFQKRITSISENKLHVRLEESGKNDEIDHLAHAFNQMMERIDISYKQQKEFTDNASHELRTPITRIIMQVQNLIKHENHSENTLRYLESIMNDSNQMADTISSLLLLSRIDKNNLNKFLPPCRLDEVIFDAIDSISKTYPDFHIHFNIENQSSDETNIEIKGDSNLLKIVFVNLLKNAYLYSNNKQVSVIMKQHSDILKVEITNTGKTLSTQEQENMFKAFSRGGNSQNIPGTGLGLRIAERISNYHNAQIEYCVPSELTNCFIVSFGLQ